MDQNLKRQKVNRKHHQKSKLNTDHVLLRLPKGGKEQVDRMAAHFGVARPALFELYLLPLFGVIASHYEVLAARANRAECCVPSFLDWLINVATVDSEELFAAAAHHELCTQFDALFGGPSEEGTTADVGGH